MIIRSSPLPCLDQFFFSINFSQISKKMHIVHVRPPGGAFTNGDSGRKCVPCHWKSPGNRCNPVSRLCQLGTVAAWNSHALWGTKFGSNPTHRDANPTTVGFAWWVSQSPRLMFPGMLLLLVCVWALFGSGRVFTDFTLSLNRLPLPCQELARDNTRDYQDGWFGHCSEGGHH